jgi:hypothetical protein
METTQQGIEIEVRTAWKRRNTGRKGGGTGTLVNPALRASVIGRH